MPFENTRYTILKGHHRKRKSRSLYKDDHYPNEMKKGVGPEKEEGNKTEYHCRQKGLTFDYHRCVGVLDRLLRKSGIDHTIVFFFDHSQSPIYTIISVRQFNSDLCKIEDDAIQ
jgi:hypothetical protein